LDSNGTILAAVVLGPWLGGFTGLATNLILGLIFNPTFIPFAVVNTFIGLAAGWISRRWGYERFWLPLSSGVFLGLTCAVLATPIAVYLFGGLTGAEGVDKMVQAFYQSGQEILSSTFFARILTNMADKTVGAFLVWGIVLLIPTAWRGYAHGPGAALGTGEPIVG
jgi:energy-coupling factor transport system substrate-specific component